MSNLQHTFKVTLVVKGLNRQEAEAQLLNKLKLADWFNEDLLSVTDKRATSDYPYGSLLWYKVHNPDVTALPPDY